MSRGRSEQSAVPGIVAVVVAVHLLALLVFPDGVPPVGIFSLAGASGVAAGTGLAVAGESRTWAAGIGGCVTVAAVAGWALTSVAALQTVAVGVATVATTASYLTHRYERLTLGLLEDVNE